MLKNIRCLFNVSIVSIKHMIAFAFRHSALYQYFTLIIIVAHTYHYCYSHVTELIRSYYYVVYSDLPVQNLFEWLHTSMNVSRSFNRGDGVILCSCFRSKTKRNNNINIILRTTGRVSTFWRDDDKHHWTVRLRSFGRGWIYKCDFGRPKNVRVPIANEKSPIFGRPLRRGRNAYFIRFRCDHNDNNINYRTIVIRTSSRSVKKLKKKKYFIIARWVKARVINIVVIESLSSSSVHANPPRFCTVVVVCDLDKDQNSNYASARTAMAPLSLSLFLSLG